MERNFVVDARLLRELGERLVGEPHIALAELIKNSYDADATQVLITFEHDVIEVVDDGHGMTLRDFEDRWLRIGTTHKNDQERSPRFGRPLTGSKGVGRLSAQLLADSLKLETRSDGERRVRATVDWDAAVEAGLLTEYPIQVTTSARSDTTFAGGAAHGTRIRLTGLKSDWDADAFENVAREIWPLQPPFHGAAGPDSDVFHVELQSTFADVEAAFAEQMGRVLELWSARIIGRLLPEDAPIPASAAAVRRPSDAGGNDEDADVAADFLYDGSGDGDGLPPRVVELEVEFADRDSYRIAYVLPECSIDVLEYERRKRRLAGLPNYRLVRYADDFVLMVDGTREDAEALRDELAQVLTVMGLVLSEAKTHITHIDEGLDFLGYRIQRHQKRGTNKWFVYTYPSKTGLAAIKAKVKALTTTGRNRPLADLLRRLRPVLQGWTSYFKHGASKASFGHLRAYTWNRVVRWLRRKHPRANWKQLRRRYLPGWWPTDGDTRLFDPSGVPVRYYRYRGTAIPSPWPTEDDMTAA